MKHLLWGSVLCMMLLASCQRESDDLDSMNLEQLYETFDGQLPADFIGALIHMGEMGDYTLADLEDVGHRMIVCQGNLPCLNGILNPTEISDFRHSLRITTLPVIELSLAHDAFWSSEYDSDAQNLILRHRISDLVFHVDLDNGLDDGRQPGIIPEINGTRYQTEHEGGSINLIRPTTDGGDIDRIQIWTEGEVIHYRFEGGTYAELSNSNDQEKIFLEGTCRIAADQANIELRGLYYILLPKGGTAVDFQYEDGQDEFTVASDAVFLVYRENVHRLRISNAFPAQIMIESDVRRLQFDAREGQPNFELDFDHSYKDRGQKVVTSSLTIVEPLQPK